jgi:hypothetical protein
MGDLGFNTLKEYLKLRAGNRADLEAAGDSSLNYYGIWINAAYRQLCSQRNVLGLNKNLYFPQLMTSTTKTTTDGTAYVTAPTDVLYITEVFDTTNGRKLDGISWKKYIEYTDRTTAASEGDPTEWVRSGSRIYLHATPGTTGDTITIYYKKLVASMSGTATTDIGAEWDDVIVELAAYHMFRWLHEIDKAKNCRESFLEMAAGLAAVYALEEKDRDEAWGVSDSYLR